MGHTFDALSQSMTLADGVELSPVFDLGALTEATLVHRPVCTRVASVAYQAGTPLGDFSSELIGRNTSASALRTPRNGDELHAIGASK
ncbi:hypothetical protein FZI85_22070 [Mycobacterium sp. CBMA293]|uniref:hypothetical protein n=1 Tax=unclassified Mycolicibacterium TaxID=2636767 RepID=UPI0012DC767A|nr:MULTISPECIES: hypothetical protein [unclassified Mycolicibacterium]MUL47374.1 hypothetical protein [Mycolicibacterium sp. CBMA 360]MUL61487.1 hypothetical protein [Mycolicibacterium sp. CBMA 335]MUL72222.1 hypothetical protein [Mycolicibacterium sp. CBMA 311]MUL97437.1 hypothetical protein [Mycolicibacterium sp. CBMA 230]MUM08788.1 hypothetical protein [Mycolicibacterium sp. CBMA 213]